MELQQRTYVILQGHSSKEAQGPSGLIWEWVVEPGNPVRLVKRRYSNLLLLFLCLAGSWEGREGGAEVLNGESKGTCLIRAQAQVLASIKFGSISSFLLSLALWESLEDLPG